MTTQDAIARIQGNGFIAALDQSGGSTPKALKAYGIEEGAWGSEEEMFELIHNMRTRIIVNPKFDERVCGAILFERTMNSEIDGMPTAKYLSEVKNIVPFLKVDEGLKDEENGVQLMKEMKGLTERLASANSHGIFGTKMRSVINDANAQGIAAIVDQQFDVGNTIIAAGLMPILEPEVNIKSATKAECEALLRDAILTHLDQLGDDKQIMLKLSLPDEANFYRDLITHPRVLRVVALSGGYSTEEANEKLAANNGMTASFSRALVQDLRADQSDEEFTATLDSAIQGIYEASIT
ncbi:MAG: fructose bisphosphate aldolase [Candidatus Peregrinibacteria bacterium]|nr:fructose bisphosphate aldolase [Candidatus Peregrinibacteria bacterium]MCB9807773.1 fructose bisphosphate aldolase [Candidatus Peribacteria bacterium]